MNTKIGHGWFILKGKNDKKVRKTLDKIIKKIEKQNKDTLVSLDCNPLDTEKSFIRIELLERRIYTIGYTSEKYLIYYTFSNSLKAIKSHATSWLLEEKITWK